MDRKEKIQHGICVECTVQSQPGKRTCARHDQKRREAARAYAQLHKVEIAAKARERREDKRTRGECIACTKPVVSNQARCEHHSRLLRATQKANQEKRKAQGLCAYGGCTQKLQTLTQCAEHANRMSAYVKKRRVERQRQGLCIDCGQPKDLDVVHCSRCNPKAAEVARRKEVKRQQRIEKQNREKEVRIARNQYLEAIIPLLNARNARLISLRFGIGETQDRTLAATGKILGISRERVRQIATAVLNGDYKEAIKASIYDQPVFIAGMQEVLKVAGNVVERRKIRARAQAQVAAKDRLLVQAASCDGGCGNLAVLKHHEDYDRPLDVIYLCRKCHSRRHREIRSKISLERSQVIRLAQPEPTELW